MATPPPTGDMTMANETRQRRLGLGWPIAIFMSTALLAGGFAGYNKAAVPRVGDQRPRTARP